MIHYIRKESEKTTAIPSPRSMALLARAVPLVNAGGKTPLQAAGNALAPGFKVRYDAENITVACIPGGVFPLLE